MSGKRGNPNWKPGVSGNPNGRPTKGESLTEALEKAIDKDELAELLKMMAFEKHDIVAIKYIYDRIGGTPTATNFNINQQLPDVVEYD